MTAAEKMRSTVQALTLKELLNTYKMIEGMRGSAAERSIVSAILFAELSNRIEDEDEFDRLVLGA